MRELHAQGRFTGAGSAADHDEFLTGQPYGVAVDPGHGRFVERGDSRPQPVQLLADRLRAHVWREQLDRGLIVSAAASCARRSQGPLPMPRKPSDWLRCSRVSRHTPPDLFHHAASSMRRSTTANACAVSSSIVAGVQRSARHFERHASISTGRSSSSNRAHALQSCSEALMSASTFSGLNIWTGIMRDLPEGFGTHFLTSVRMSAMRSQSQYLRERPDAILYGHIRNVIFH